MMRRRSTLILLGLMLAGCNLGLPQATPTVAPTRTASRTPSPLPSDAPTLTHTATRIAIVPSPTPTSTSTMTPSSAPTATWTASPTAQPTVTETRPVPTPLPQPTTVPTLTPLPTIGPTRTSTAPAAATSVPTITPSATSTATPIPAPSGTPAAFAPVGERPPEFPQPTIMATPTFVTGESNFVQPTSLPTAVDVLPPTTLPLALPPTAVPAQFVTPGVIRAVDTRAFALSITNGVFSGRLFEMPGGTLTFAQDPLNVNRLALVDARGLLFVFHDFAGGHGGRVASSPFSEPEPASAETNNARVTQIAYSPDGRYLAFLIDTDGDSSNDNDSSNDGVWILPLAPSNGQPAGSAAILLRDCPPEAGCMIVDRPDSPYRYRSQSMAWSASGDALIITVELPEEGRQGVAVVYPEAPNPAARPPILRYDDATWANDGQRLVVSGRGPDGRIVVGTVTRQGGEPQLRDVVLMGIGWAEHAVQRPNGQFVFLGGPAADSPLRLYDGDGIALTAPIGSAHAVRVVWSPDRSAVMVATEENGRIEYYVALVDSGQVQRITDQAGGVMALAWTSALPSPGASGSAPVSSVTAVVNERPAVVIAGDGLFIRSAPSSSAEVVASVLFDQTVTITGEAVTADGILWYPARAPDGVTGWIAGRIGGAETLRF